MGYWIQCCNICLFINALQPHAPEPVIPYQDEFLHNTAYFIYALLWRAALVGVKNEKISSYAIPIAVVIAILYGAINEVYQSFIPDRVYDLGDIIANALGAVLAGLRRI